MRTCGIVSFSQGRAERRSVLTPGSLPASWLSQRGNLSANFPSVASEGTAGGTWVLTCHPRCVAAQHYPTFQKQRFCLPKLAPVWAGDTGAIPVSDALAQGRIWPPSPTACLLSLGLLSTNIFIQLKHK